MFMTKKLKAKYVTAALISLLLNVGPLLVFTIIAFISGTAIVHKVTLSMTLLLVLIFSIITLVNKTVFRSKLWILLIGLWLCLDNILTPLIVFAACQVVDELVVTSIKKYYKDRYKINKEIDKRL